MKNTTICYINKEEKTLLLHRIKKDKDIHQGKWVGLGGKMEKGETPEECIVREVKEESGLAIKSPILKGIITFPKFKDGEDWYMFIFEASEFEGTLIDDCPEGKLEWVENSKIAGLPMWEGDHLFLEWMKSDRFFSGKITYIDGKLIDSSVIFY